jgi:hypothetical protein
MKHVGGSAVKKLHSALLRRPPGPDVVAPPPVNYQLLLRFNPSVQPLVPCCLISQSLFTVFAQYAARRVLCKDFTYTALVVSVRTKDFTSLQLSAPLCSLSTRASQELRDCQHHHLSEASTGSIGASWINWGGKHFSPTRHGETKRGPISAPRQ